MKVSKSRALVYVGVVRLVIDVCGVRRLAPRAPDVRLPLRTARWNGAELVFNPGDQATCADFPGLPPRLPTGTAALPFCAEEAQ